MKTIKPLEIIHEWDEELRILCESVGETLLLRHKNRNE